MDRKCSDEYHERHRFWYISNTCASLPLPTLLSFPLWGVLHNGGMPCVWFLLSWLPCPLFGTQRAQSLQLSGGRKLCLQRFSQRISFSGLVLCLIDLPSVINISYHIFFSFKNRELFPHKEAFSFILTREKHIETYRKRTAAPCGNYSV